MISNAGPFALGESHDGVDVVVGDKAYRFVSDPETARSHGDLIRRLFGAGHHHRVASTRQRTRQLEEEGRLAHTGLTAKEKNRACHHPTTEHAVDLSPTGHSPVARLLRGSLEAHGLGRPDLSPGFGFAGDLAPEARSTRIGGKSPSIWPIGGRRSRIEMPLFSYPG